MESLQEQNPFCDGAIAESTFMKQHLFNNWIKKLQKLSNEMVKSASKFIFAGSKACTSHLCLLKEQ
jgi:hypothetical protein